MADTAYSGTPLARKLGIEPGMRVRLYQAPSAYWRLLDPAGARGQPEEVYELDATPADFQHLFATDEATLERGFAAARKAMAEDGMVWASWPKKSSGVESEIGRSEVMAAGQRTGLVDVKVCSVDATWSGLKFVIPVAERRTRGSSSRR